MPLRIPVLQLLGLLLAFGQGGEVLRAQNGAPQAAQTLELMRLHFQRGLLESSLTPLKRHLIELSALEKQRAEARDYAGAIEARDLRRRLEDDLERLDKELLLLQTREHSLESSLLPDRIPLALEAAELNGVTRQGDMLTGWNKPGASARWRLSGVPRGGYEVILRYRCGPLEGGRVQVQESRYSLSAEVETTLKGPLTRNLGTLKITDGSGTLTLSAASVVKDNLMQLLAVELMPVGR